ncbi:biotin-dependent carboxyltransferase family protein [Actinomadura fulvescens]|uniref:Biotin-dependent carboxyltransferase family protein n=1 Tax=Actinomadura fulvescens TaxID=46160 RepID=A0ABN3PI63_9ACTN
MTLEVIAAGPFSTVQDLGRPGHAALGVGASGAADPAALRLANRALGNAEDAAALEVTLGGLTLHSHIAVYAIVTGAPAPITVNGRAEPPYAPFFIPKGAEVHLATPPTGLRSYLAVRGGIETPRILGSRSTDTLAKLGTPLAPGTVLPTGKAAIPPNIDVLPVQPPPAGDLDLHITLGPRADWFTEEALRTLTSHPYEVTAQIDRVGMRLTGPPLTRARTGELPSEGMVTGALQVPPSGTPVLFLADHPLTGGYPVIAVVTIPDIGRAAQARPGQRLRFHA